MMIGNFGSLALQHAVNEWTSSVFRLVQANDIGILEIYTSVHHKLLSRITDTWICSGALREWDETYVWSLRGHQ